MSHILSRKYREWYMIWIHVANVPIILMDWPKMTMTMIQLRLATVASSFHHQISERSFRLGLIGSEIIWRGEKQYWKNKDGKPLEVTISSIHSTGFSHDKYYNHYNCSFFPLHSASGLGFGYFLFPNIFLGTYIYSSCFDSMYLITAWKTPIIWRSSSRISDWARHGPPINTCLLGSWRWPIFYPG